MERGPRKLLKTTGILSQALKRNRVARKNFLGEGGIKGRGLQTQNLLRRQKHFCSEDPPLQRQKSLNNAEDTMRGRLR